MLKLRKGQHRSFRGEPTAGTTQLVSIIR